ncbi:MAG: hypothetical protein GF332_00875 [Candidatus Moranbacteria bacterium]|nr:hypothetical protein [Candidatus Moranbacteria bacterium]
MRDLIIIGAGPAGLTASIYASRFFLKNLIIADQLGGTMAQAHKIENYPGFSSISGLELANKMNAQAQELGAEIKFEKVTKIKKNPQGIYQVFTNKMDQEPYQALMIVLATGMQRRSLNIKGEKEFQGRGVSYCSTCDAAFFKDKIVAVIGGANAATMSAVHLSNYAKKVYLIYRKDNLRGEPIWNQRALDNDKIQVVYNTNITQIKGDKMVESIVLDKSYQGNSELKVNGVFIEIGHVPIKILAQQMGLDLSDKGFIKTDELQKTNLSGVFAAGDVTNRADKFRQVVTAVKDGALAARSAFEYKNQFEQSKKSTVSYR